MSGWIKIHRSILNHWLYEERRKFSKFEAWNDILLNVNFSPAKTIIKGKLLEINRGESILSLESWGKRWGWDKSAVKRFLDLLKKDNMIDYKNETVTIRLTVCNYDTYQDMRNDNETRTKRVRNAHETQTKPIEEEYKKTIEERKNIFKQTLIPFLEKYGKDMLNDFYLHWTQVSKNGKLGFELEKTWSVEARLNTWSKRSFNNQQKPQQQENNSTTLPKSKLYEQR